LVGGLDATSDHHATGKRHRDSRDQCHIHHWGDWFRSLELSVAIQRHKSPVGYHHGGGQWDCGLFGGWCCSHERLSGWTFCHRR
jgi:hypothetical protein